MLGFITYLQYNFNGQKIWSVKWLMTSFDRTACHMLRLLDIYDFQYFGMRVPDGNTQRKSNLMKYVLKCYLHNWGD